MKIRVDFEFFRTPAGSVYELVEDSYSMNVCDCCGKPRSCDYYVDRILADAMKDLVQKLEVRAQCSEVS